MTHICVGNLVIIGSDNGLSPGRRQAIIWTNAGILFIGPLETNLSEILIEILTFAFKKMRLKVSSAKWRPFCLGLNVLSSRLQNGSYAVYTSFSEVYSRIKHQGKTQADNRLIQALPIKGNSVKSKSDCGWQNKSPMPENNTRETNPYIYVNIYDYVVLYGNYYANMNITKIWSKSLTSKHKTDSILQGFKNIEK